jgi:GGDEF domain-containing protein
MLAHSDEDDDGDLDLVAAFGFSADPEHSAVVQRFAREVLELDEIVRDDDPGSTVGPMSPADEEIDQLVAIPLFLRDRFDGVIICANRPGGFEEVGDELLLALGDHAGTALQHGRLRNEVREAQRGTVRALAEATAAWDPLVHRESGRLAVLAGRLGSALGFDERETDVLVCATVLRAIGHLPLPEQPLRKLGQLTREERAVLEMHPRLGFNMLAQAPGLRDVAVTLLYHHERVDGAGYPAGLAGDNIPVAARALHVLEAFGAMTHDRPYRAARGRDEACAELLLSAGSQFDERVVRAFVEVVDTPERAQEPEDAVAETLLDVLPFDPADEDGGALTRLAASAVDGQTLLGNHRALIDAVREAARDRVLGRGFAVAMAQVQDLAEINQREGYLAGDRVVQVAARAALRAAARLGGTAFRDSGRRFSIVAPLDRDEQLHDLLHEVQTEFAGGPAVRVVASPWEPGENGEDVVTRAREALLAGPDPS